MLFAVLSEVGISAAAFVEAHTFVRFLLPYVGSLVPDQIKPCTEGLATVETLTRLLSHVCPLLSHQGGAPTERFPTLGTPVRLLSGVCSLMHNKVGAEAETLSTFTARTWFPSWLDSALCHTVALMHFLHIQYFLRISFPCTSSGVLKV